MKQAIRKEVRESIAKMTLQEKSEQSENCCRQIFNSEEWQKATDVLLYAAMNDEVSLDILIREAVVSGKTVWLPVVDGKDLRLRQFIYGKTARIGVFNIEEPTEDAPELDFADYSRIGLVIVPGRAFTSNGERLGRGGGYYDKILSRFTCPKWGVAFSCQMYTTLPIDSWDKKIDSVIVGNL